ncbi:hypothetical protein KY329_04120, partial [Candidatus Woesearchaeota archaeon]|nr:hypothetical protein [Candidatus Woesearchaeota archaeon]
MTNIKVTLDRTVSEDFPDAEELVRRQLSFSRLHEVIRETLQVDPDVRVSLENDQLVAKFYDHGASLPYAPGFYVIKSLDQYKNKQPARLLQEIAACRNYLRDHIVNNMVPSAKGVPNLELLADVLSVENVQLDNHPPTAD